jgi:hypothetical protein
MGAWQTFRNQAADDVASRDYDKDDFYEPNEFKVRLITGFLAEGKVMMVAYYFHDVVTMTLEEL